jgi:plasmid stabilization system protein ParE
MTVRLSAHARSDVRDIVAWYEDQMHGLGAAFVADLSRLIERVARYPLAFPVVRAGARGPYRRASFWRFPYTIVYASHGGDLLVVAVRHKRRDGKALLQRLN